MRALDRLNPEFFESFFWKNIDELVRVFENAGFQHVAANADDSPWPGEQICFKSTTPV